MNIKKGKTAIARPAKLLLAATLAAFAASSAQAAGNINVAIIGEPDTLDPMVSTKDVVSIVTQHFLETLFTFNGSWEVAPLLAERMPAISDGGKAYRIPLRRGITFHDGSQMDSADVVASLKRWTELATRGKSVADKIASISAIDDYTVEIRMNEPYAPLLSLLAFSNSAAVVYPQEVLGENISAAVGTGPYKIASHVPDQYIQMERFDNYVSRNEQADGPAGARSQTPDEITFLPVPDANTRVEGLLAGQYDFADSLPAESYGRLDGSGEIEPFLLRPFGWPIFAFNHKDGLLVNKDIRLAVQAAISPDDMLFAAFGDDKFFVVDGPLYPEGWVWRNNEGVNMYAQADAAKAAGHLKQGGYDGTPLRILTSHQYEFHFKMAEVAKANLEAAGFQVHMDVVDWATLGQRRNNPELWDIYITHSPFLPEPSLTSLYHPTSRLGWIDRSKDDILDAFNTTTDQAERVKLFAQLQKAVFEQAAFIKIGGFNSLMGKKKDLAGITKTPWPFFWNAALN